MKYVILAVLAATVFSGCASSPRAKRIEAVKKVQEEVDDLKKIKADKADTNMRLDDVKTELQILSGKIEENQHFLRQTEENHKENSKRLDQFSADYDSKIATLEKDQKERFNKLENQINELSKKISGRGAPREGGRGAESDTRYDYVNGMKRFHAGEYDQAIEFFSRYVQNFPKGRAIHDAMFYLGEAFYKNKNYEDAILKYEEYKEKHPKGKEVPEAIYKQGLSFQKVGKNADAKTFFQELISNYPKSPYAEKAKMELKRLKQ